MPRALIDIKGQRFGRLLVIEVTEQRTAQGQPKWLCQCDCGNTYMSTGGNLRNGTTTSCGCGKRDRATNLKLDHGKHGHDLYTTWVGMRQRCNDTEADNYERYGGRGITVCDRWNSFQCFLEDMEATWKEGLTLDRKDNEGNYDPSNCRWATAKEQAANKRPRAVNENASDIWGFSSPEGSVVTVNSQEV